MACPRPRDPWRAPREARSRECVRRFAVEAARMTVSPPGGAVLRAWRSPATTCPERARAPSAPACGAALRALIRATYAEVEEEPTSLDAGSSAAASLVQQLAQATPWLRAEARAVLGARMGPAGIG